MKNRAVHNDTFILGAAIAAFAAGCGGLEGSRPTDVEDTIVGGTSTTIASHPWQISLQENGGFHFCGGSIIADSWILTAAHCVEGSSPSSMRIVAGITRRSQASSGQIRSIEEVIVYPGYVTSELGKDAALLRLSSPLDLSGANARAIPIATPADAAAGLTNAGRNAVVTGWGTTRSGGSSFPDTLQVVTVPIVSNADASEAYGQTITADQLAAGTGGRDSCQGDSGGPLTVADASGSGRLLAGIVSWGQGCGDPNFPGLYGRVSSFAEWINSHISTNSPPAVAITAPLGGATVSGVIAVSANATDSDGTIASVRFLLPDGTTREDTTRPYSVQWDSATVGDGTVTIRAIATDNAGATSQSAVTVVAANGNTSCASGTFPSSDTPVSIPDNDANGVRSTISVSGSGEITSLRLSLDITHTYRGDLVVSLIAPSGASFMISNRAGGSADNLVLQNQSITGAIGESAAGAWTLSVQDRDRQDLGTLRSWSLAISADCTGGGGGGGGGPWSASAQPNLPTVDNGSACTSLTVAQSGDASLVKLDISGRHDWRSILRGTLEHNGVRVDAFPTSTFPREGGAFSFTNRAISGFSGDAAGTWTLCIIDTDAFGDTGVLETWSVHE